MPTKKSATRKINHTPNALRGIQKREKIVQLRIDGYSYAEIARQVNVSKDHAHSVVKDYMTEFRQKMSESLENAVILEVERLNECIRVMYAKVISSGDCDAAKTMTTLMQRKSSYLGLDKALKLDIESSAKLYVGVSPDDWSKMNNLSNHEQTNLSKI